MKPRDFDDLNIVRPLPTMLFEGSMLSHLSSAPMTKFLFDHGYVVHSMVPMGTVSEKRGVPRLHEVPVVNTTGQKRHPIPGEKFLLSCICGDAGMNHTRRAHPMLCPDDGTHPRIIIITRAYKNDWKSVQAHIQALDGWEEDKSKPLYTDNFDGKLTVFGSGGAPEILGTHPPNYKKDTKYDSQVHIPSAQPLETSKTNQALLKMKLENQCVAVYVNRDEMFETDEAYSAARPPNCCFLGYFRCAQFIIDDLPAAAVHALYKNSNSTQATLMHSQFQQVPHIRLNLEPLFNNDDLQKMRTKTDIAKDYKILAVDHDCADEMLVDIPMGGAEAALAVLDRSSMYRSFIDRGDYMRYLKNPSTADDDVPNDDDRTDKIYIDECRKSRVTVSLLVDACLVNNAAGAFRAMKTNITLAEGKEVAGPLMIETLPVICRLQSTPMSNRALDVVCLFLRRDCKDAGLFQRTGTMEGQRITYSNALKSDLVDVAFKAILLRFTGRINAFRNYSLHENTSPMIPLVDDLGKFLEFMK
jgi:hypothetical protein